MILAVMVWLVLVSFVQMWVVSFLFAFTLLEVARAERPQLPRCCIRRYRVSEPEPEDLQYE